MNYVIIGNSAAAVGAVEGIRQLDRSGSITILSREPYHTYSRPLISYLLGGQTDEQRMRYRPEDFYRKNAACFRPGTTAAAVVPDRKEVVLDSGEQIPYDRLLVATGSTPFIPPMVGLETVEKKFTFLSLEDAYALEDALFPEARVLIVGAGLIGLKCAEGICGRTGQITVVDLADRVLPSILDETGAALIQTHLESHGLHFLLSDSIEAFTGNTARLRSGRQLDFDLLVVAVGVRPNTELVQTAGGDVSRGIRTDRFCRTSLPDIWAAGDCAESRDLTTGQDRVLALLPNAYMQGECAGISMAGGEKPYERAIPMNAIGFFGLHIMTAGSYDGESFTDSIDGGYKRLVVRDNRLVGYILIGTVECAGIYTALIRDQTPLDTIDFELIREKPQLMAFSKVDRQKKLGGGHS